MITIRKATDRDVSRVMEIMEAAHRAMPDPSQYITDDRAYVERHVTEEGFILLGEVDGVTAGFLMVVLPEFIVGNTGYDPSYFGDHLARTSIMDSAAVHPDYWGLGLQRKLLEAAIAQVRPVCDYCAATVSPENQYSRRNMEVCGFRPIRTVVKPGGETRYVMELCLQADSPLHQV